MKTAQETLDYYFRKDADAFFDDKEVLKLLIQAMEEYAENYHQTKVKNLAQPDVSGQYFSNDKLIQAFDGAREQKEIDIYLKDQNFTMKVKHPYKYSTANEWIEQYFC